MRGVGVAAERRADSAKLVGSYSGPDTAATNKDSDIHLSTLDCFSNFPSIIWIIVSLRAIVSTEVDDLVARVSGPVLGWPEAWGGHPTILAR